VRAELVIELEVIALAEQVEIEIGEDGWKAIGILELDHTFPETRAQVVARGPIGEPPSKQASLVHARQFAFVPIVVDRNNLFGIRHEGTHHRLVTFDMEAEIVERVGVTALDHRIGFLRQRGHAATASDRDKIRNAPAIGTRTQSGR
jgi:hypothetical protein